MTKINNINDINGCITDHQYNILNEHIIEYNKYIMLIMKTILDYKDWTEQSFNSNITLSKPIQYKFYIADKINTLFSFPDWYLHTTGSLIPQEWATFIVDKSNIVN